MKIIKILRSIFRKSVVIYNMEPNMFLELPADLQLVIGVIGPKGSGKDTIADHSIKNLGAKGKIVTASFLKKMCAKVFNLNITAFTINKDKPFQMPLRFKNTQVRDMLKIIRDNIPEDKLPLKDFNPRIIGFQKYMDREFKTPRELLQYVGTDVIQSIFKPFHCYVAYKGMVNFNGVWFISDMRFKHEYDHAQELFQLFYTIKIQGRNEVEDGKEEHLSESEYKTIPYNYIVDNSEEGLDHLYSKIQDIFKEIIKDALLKYPNLPKRVISNSVAKTETEGTQNLNPHFVFSGKESAVPIRFYDI